jgi:membrane protease YdiL (CAAX protease family)
MKPAGIHWNDALVVGLALIAASLALAPLIILLVQRIHPGRNVFFARWGFSHVALTLGVTLAALLGIHQLFPVAEGERLDAVGALLRTAVALALGCAVVVAFAGQLAPEGARSLGLARGRHASAIAAGLLAYFLFLPGLFGVMIAWKSLLDRIAPGVEPQGVMTLMLELEPSQRLYAVLLGVLAIPLLEELLFRAFLQPLLVQNLRDRLGIVMTALVFGLLHGTAACVPVFALALLLGGIMLRTQSLPAVWAVHGLHNALMFVVIFVFPEAARSLQSHGLLVW